MAAPQRICCDGLPIRSLHWWRADSMRIGIDGLILSDPLTGIGHYTLELARHLALNNGSDEYLLVSPRPLSPANNLLGEKPANLGFQHLTLNPFTRHWWSIGLPRFIRS